MPVNNRKFIIIAALLLISNTNVQEVIGQETVSQQCLQCICQGASGCDNLTGCKDDVCGPYRITEPYWCDSGKPGNDGNSADGGFGRCVDDPSCAAQAVQGYMARFGHDCNGDGRVDCDDYARIHRLGPVGCMAGALPQDFQERYSTCMGGGSVQAGIGGAQPAGYAQPAGGIQPAAYAQPTIGFMQAAISPQLGAGIPPAVQQHSCG